MSTEISAQHVTDSITSQARAFADEAYGVAVSTTDVEERAYAAGVEDMARWLATGQCPSVRFAEMAELVQRRPAFRQRVR